MNDLLVAKDQVRYEQKIYWRNPMAAVFTFMFPVIFLLVIGTGAGSGKIQNSTLRYNQYLVVAMLVFGLVSACYINLGVTLCIRRDSGVLKRMRGTPMSMLSYVAGIVGSVIINVALITVLVVSIGMAGFNLHFPYHSAAAAITILVGVLTFSALGLAVTVLVPNAEAAQAVMNGTALPIVFISGVFYPVNNSSILAKIADFFPVRHLVKGLVGAFETGPGSGFQGGDILIMLLWAAAAFLYAFAKFRWEPRHR